MTLKRLISLSHTEATRIRNRQIVGTMTEFYDDDGYLCYDEDDLNGYKPRKRGRRPRGFSPINTGRE